MDVLDGEIRGNKLLTGEDGPMVIARHSPSIDPVKHNFWR